MKISSSQLLDEALAIRAEATLTGRCPRCGSDDSALPLFTPGKVSEGRFSHESWCPAVDDNVARLFRRTEAKMFHYMLQRRTAAGRPVLVAIIGREGNAPLSDDQLDRLTDELVPRERRN